jgi:ribonuclease D
VTHLRGIYEHLRDSLAKSGRTAWLDEELGVLTEPATYTIEPSEAWRRVKTRNPSGKLLAIIRELAELREGYAQSKNVPRSRVYKDDAMMEIASTKPSSVGDLSKLRLLTREGRKGPMAENILKAVARGMAVKPENYPKAPPAKKKQQGAEGLTELLRVLLKAKAEQAGVAQKMIATISDLDEIAAGLRDGPIFSGWRNEVFGEDAARLCNGKVALSAQGRFVKIVSI